MNRKTLRSPPAGTAAVMGILIFLLVIPLLALTIDVANAYRVRAELQVTADASALAGAGSLYSGGTGPQWTLAEERAKAVALLHSVQGRTVTEVTAELGYWSEEFFFEELGSFAGYIESDSYPAIRITVSKGEGSNSGPFYTIFGSSLGLGALNLSASAIAIVSGPGELAAETMFPFVMSSCLYTHFWDSGADPSGPAQDPNTGEPYIFELGENFETPPCGTLQGFWTSYTDAVNSANTLRNLVDALNARPLRVGDQVWLPTGQMNTVYSYIGKRIQTCEKSGQVSCNTVVVAVIDAPAQGQWSTVRAFSCIRLISASGGSKPHVKVQMNTACDSEGTGGIGPFYLVGSPKLVQ